MKQTNLTERRHEYYIAHKEKFKNSNDRRKEKNPNLNKENYQKYKKSINLYSSKAYKNNRKEENHYTTCSCGIRVFNYFLKAHYLTNKHKALLFDKIVKQHDEYLIN